MATLDSSSSTTTPLTRSVTIPAAGAVIAGDVAGDGITAAPLGMIVFAHGSGSSRMSPRNQYIASILRQHGFVTLLLDLLTADEQYMLSRRFDIALLTTRLAEAVRWVREQPNFSDTPIGLFGASTGAAAALRVAAVASAAIRAVVSRGGRTDLTGPLVTKVKAPTLLIVGGEDRDVLELNQQTLSELTCEKRLAIIPGATHLFEEPGALDDVGHLAAYWFRNHVGTTLTRPHAP
jgi:putative phosphoribosyl transferase